MVGGQVEVATYALAKPGPTMRTARIEKRLLLAAACGRSGSP